MSSKVSIRKHFPPIRLPYLLLLFILAGCAVSPQPFSQADLQGKAQSDLKEIFSDQESLTEELTLYDAMARAIKYNLNYKVKLLEDARAQGILDQSKKDLLPQLVASAGYATRNNYNASYSENLSTGSKTGETELSVSEEKSSFSSELVLVWNVLDFGVGYYQAKQQADNVLVAEEYRRKAAQNISQELRYAFWRAVSAERLLPKMDTLVKQAESALGRSRQMEKGHVDNPVKVLDYQQKLLETVQQLWRMRRSLALAKTELATLMNVRPGRLFTLKVPLENRLEYPEFSLDLLEEYALRQRPELRTEAYLERIGAAEVKKAMLRMLPGFELTTGASYDSNGYLYNNDWIHAGLNLSWNAFSLLSAPTAIQNAEMQRELARQRHMAASMMVLSQVNIAKQQYHLSLKEYQISMQIDEVHRRKLWHSSAAKKAKTGTELEEIRSQVNALSAEMQLGLAFSELQGAIGSIYNSIGYDPMPERIPSHALKGLAETMKSHDSKVLSYFTQNPGNTYVIENPFVTGPVLDVNNSLDTKSSIAEGAMEERPAQEAMAAKEDLDAAAIPPVTVPKETMIYKSKNSMKSTTRNEERPPTPAVEDKTARKRATAAPKTTTQSSPIIHLRRGW